MKKVGDAVWIRIGIHEGVSSSSQHLWLPSNVIYMIHHPCSQYIIISKVKVSHRDYLMQVIMMRIGKKVRFAPMIVELVVQARNNKHLYFVL